MEDISRFSTSNNNRHLSGNVSLHLQPRPQDIVVQDRDSEWPLWTILLTTIPMTFLIIEIILGNLMVIIAVLTQRALRTPSNMIILSLAVADLAVGVFILPFNVADMIIGWRFGTVLCRIWLTSDVTLCSTSILHISAIAVDRFRSINEGVPYAQSRTIRMSLIVCGALWLIALWIASAPVLGWNDWGEVDDPYNMECILTRELGYIIHSASGAFFIPAAIMVGLYFRIFLLIRYKLRQRAKIACVSGKSKTTADDNANLKDPNKTRTLTLVPPVMVMDDQEASSGDIVEEASTETDTTKDAMIVEAEQKSNCDVDAEGNCWSNKGRKKHSEQIENILREKMRFSLTKERKAAKTLGIIIGAFIICWTPFTMIYLVSGILVELWPDDRDKHIPFWLFQSVTWLGYVNSGLNPIIYTVYNPEFKRAFTLILNKFRCRK